MMRHFSTRLFNRMIKIVKIAKIIKDYSMTTFKLTKRSDKAPKLYNKQFLFKKE